MQKLFTLGVEEEFQIVDPSTRDLRPHVEQARYEVARLRAGVAELAGNSGLAIVASGAHPFSHWQSQIITENERYKVLEQDLQDVVRSILIFGLHVHVGIPDRDLLIDI